MSQDHKMRKLVWGLLAVLSCSIWSTHGEELSQCFPASPSSPASTDALPESKLHFTLDLFHKLYAQSKAGKQEGNLFFSPHSLHSALLMSYFGSKGETETELRKVLRLSEAPKSEHIQAYKMDSFYRELSCRNNTSSGLEVDLRVASRIYFDENEPVRECVEKIFENEVQRMNTSSMEATEQSRQSINNWVEESTNGKIKDLIPSLKSDTRMVIVNSAYFKGRWEQQFKKSKTKPALFYVSSDEVVQTMMMYQKGSFRRGASEDLKAYIVELPYEGQSISMFILLPPFTPNALQETVSRLNASTLHDAMENLYTDSLEVFLPQFKLQQNLELADTLGSIGIQSIFNASSANFSDFSTAPGLYVDKAVHKSIIEVNEEGATAAAATALIATRSGRPLDATRFVCNHPFIFFIYDKCAKSVLFIGAFHKPSKSLF